jgi:predicted NAD/FAD-dependent oxidoreductase
MSSRSLDGFSFDHGAVCFSDKVFKDVVQLLDGSNALAKWDARFGTLSANKEGIWTFDKDEGDSNHYVGVPTMNEVCKYLLDSPLVSTCFSTPVSSGQLQDGTWALSDRKGAELGSYQVLVSTDKLMADEQSPNFFKGVGADLSAFHSLAHSCEMKAQFVLMLGFKNSLGLPFDAAFAATKLPALKSLSNESSKPGRATSGESWTVQSSTTFAADVLRYPVCPSPTHTQSHFSLSHSQGTSYAGRQP